MSLSLVRLTFILSLIRFLQLHVSPLLKVIRRYIIFPATFPRFMRRLRMFINLVMTTIIFSLFTRARNFNNTIRVANGSIPTSPSAARVIRHQRTSNRRVQQFVDRINNRTRARVSNSNNRHQRRRRQIISQRLSQLFRQRIRQILVSIMRTSSINSGRPIRRSTLRRLHRSNPMFRNFMLNQNIT